MQGRASRMQALCFNIGAAMLSVSVVAAASRQAKIEVNQRMEQRERKRRELQVMSIAACYRRIEAILRRR
jgi:ABC-type nickel/cobalt efflux system permease component RcnA